MRGGRALPKFFVHFSQTVYIGSIWGWGGRGRPLPNFFGTVAFKKVVQVVQIRGGRSSSWSPNSTVLHLDIHLLYKYTNLKDRAGQSAIAPVNIQYESICTTDHQHTVCHQYLTVNMTSYIYHFAPNDWKTGKQQATHTCVNIIKRCPPSNLNVKFTSNDSNMGQIYLLNHM